MNILKPQKILFDKLKSIEDILEELQNKDEVENINFKDYKNESIELTDITIRKAIFANVEIINSNLEKNTFIDIEFKNCNFSNTSFENCTFIRCEFNNCKLAGCNFIESTLTDVAFIECNLKKYYNKENYICFTMQKMEK